MGTQSTPDNNAGTSLVPAERSLPTQQAETSSTAVAARAKAAVEARYLMALQSPRNIDLARQRLLQRCESPFFASVAEYSKPIGGKKVTGASIRLMEEIARQYGNIDVQSTITFDDAERRIINVTAIDLESNYAQSQDIILHKTVERKHPKSTDTVIRSRLNSRNEMVYLIEADEDAFIVKQNAMISKTRREMIRAVVPGDLTEEALEHTRATRRNVDAKDPAGARKAVADAFFRAGVTARQLADYLEKPNLEAITDAELEVLRQIYTAIREGETTWKEVMEDKKPSAQVGDAQPAKGKGTEGLKAALGADKKSAKQLAEELVAKHGTATLACKSDDFGNAPELVQDWLGDMAEKERKD
jgi:hypothetical protein